MIHRSVSLTTDADMAATREEGQTVSRRSTTTVRAAAVLCAVSMLFLCAPQQTQGKDPERPSHSLTIVDVGGSTTKLSMEDLREIPQIQEKECICVGEVVGFVGVFDYKGVRVNDLLEKVKAASSISLYAKKNLYLVFKGTDGYQVIASWVELTQTAGGSRAMIATEKDGKPLPPNEGAFRLVFPGDKYVGRSVKCLERIEIHSAPGIQP
jgi:DMSO/TMAO reductase YedYZ molybdopterin-dependent catalytic subunit